MRLSVFTLALTLLAGCTSVQVAKPQPVVVNHDPAVSPVSHDAGARDASSTVRNIDHVAWSIQVPAAWTVQDNAEDRLTVVREKNATTGPAMLKVVTIKVDVADAGGTIDPAAFPTLGVLMTESMVPDDVTVTGEKSAIIEFNGIPAGVVQLNTNQGFFIGSVSLFQQSTNMGYVIVSMAPAVPSDEHLMVEITRTFKLK